MAFVEVKYSVPTYCSIHMISILAMGTIPHKSIIVS